MHRCIFTTKIIVCRLWKIKLTKRTLVLDWAAHMGSRRCNKCAMNNMQTSDGGTQHCKTGTTTTAFKKAVFFLQISSLSSFTNSLNFSGSGKSLPCLDRGTLKTLFQLGGLKGEWPLLILALASREKWCCKGPTAVDARPTRSFLNRRARQLAETLEQARAIPHNV